LEYSSSNEEFFAGATRFSLADTTDGTDDANFSFEKANNAILRLTQVIAWHEKNWRQNLLRELVSRLLMLIVCSPMR